MAAGMKIEQNLYLKKTSSAKNKYFNNNYIQNK